MRRILLFTLGMVTATSAAAGIYTLVKKCDKVQLQTRTSLTRSQQEHFIKDLVRDGFTAIKPIDRSSTRCLDRQMRTELSVFATNTQGQRVLVESCIGERTITVIRM